MASGCCALLSDISLPSCVLLQACTTCGATKSPMWRNGAAGPKTLCNACGVKYQRRMHKQKLAADSATAASAAANEDGDSGPRLHRSVSGVLRSVQKVNGSPVLTRCSCKRTAAPESATEAAFSDSHAGKHSRAVAPQATAAVSAGIRANGQPAAEVDSRKAWRLEEDPARCLLVQQNSASAQTSFVAASTTGPAAARSGLYHRMCHCSSRQSFLFLRVQLVCGFGARQRRHGASRMGCRCRHRAAMVCPSALWASPSCCSPSHGRSLCGLVEMPAHHPSPCASCISLQVSFGIPFPLVPIVLLSGPFQRSHALAANVISGGELIPTAVYVI
jgi:GATA zinc finger